MNKIADLIAKEKKRQNDSLMMIPSENYTYPEVREAVGSVLMHKYAEGQPQKRYYQGMGVVDDVELLCEQRALEAFGLTEQKWHVNVQPYSGTPANMAVFNALLNPGDKIMAMYLPDGGHLSHGWEYKGKKITLTSKIYDIGFYHVDPKTSVFDYDIVEKQALKFKPKLIVSGGTAYPREIDYRRMGQIAKKVGAYYLADVAHEAGLIAGGACKSPFPYATAVTMTTHKTLRGPRGALAFIKKEFGEELDRSIFPGLQGGPHMHTIAGIAVALEKTKSSAFKKYAKQTVVNARTLASELQKHGFDVVSGGTDKHLVLVDLRNKKTSGWFVAWALEAAGIVANRNTVPNDTGSPFYPSGLRLGTQALAVRGMKEKEMEKIAGRINEVVDLVGPRAFSEDAQERVAELKDFRQALGTNKGLKEIFAKVKELCDRFPLSGV